MEEFKKAVLDRISWAKEVIEESIISQDAIIFNMELGKIRAYYGLAQKFDFLNVDDLQALFDYGSNSIDRFYSAGSAAE